MRNGLSFMSVQRIKAELFKNRIYQEQFSKLLFHPKSRHGANKKERRVTE